MFNLKKYPKKKALNVNDSIVVSRPDGSIINFNSPISVDNTGNATFSGNVTIQGNLSILNSASQTISFGDNDKLKFGDGNDLEIFHDGSNSLINHRNTGNLIIQASGADKDIILKSDNGSGSATAYLTLDGGIAKTKFSKFTLHEDNVKAEFGDSADLQIFHDGTHGQIVNNSSNLFIKNNADASDITFQCDDGSGGTTTYFFLDGSSKEIRINEEMQFEDNVKLNIGTGEDLSFKHDGSNTFITNDKGNLTITNKQDDGDIIFECDDGSGGIADYIRLDGSETRTVIAKAMRFNDSTSLQLGGDADISTHHDGSNGFFNINTGNFTFTQNADNKDIIFKCDDGSGSATAYLTLDGSATRTVFSKETLHNDNIEAKFGGGIDLRIFSDGTDGFIKATNGDLYVVNTANDKDIIFQSDDGSGGLADYIRLDGSTTTTKFSKDTLHEDNVKGIFGTSDDLKVYHDSSNSYIENNTGSFFIMSRADDADLVLMCDDGSGGDTAYITLDGSDSAIKVGKELQVNGDNRKLKLGAGNDLEIYHSGSQSYIDHTGTGNLYIRTRNNSSIYLQDTNNQAMAQFTDGSGCFFYHANNLKFSVTSTGIDVSGAIEMDKSLTMSHISDPSDPATGKSVMWSNTDGDLKIKINVGGTVVTRTLATFSD